MIYEFAATQSYNGYDKPWPAGGGVNKLPTLSAYDSISNGIRIQIDNEGKVKLSGTATETTAFPFDIPEITLPSANIYIHLMNSAVNSSVGVFFLYNSTNVAGITAGGLQNRINKNDSLSGATINQTRYYVSSGQTIDMTLSPMLCLDGTAKPFAPYSNICPPEGFNIWDPSNDEYIQVYAGYVNANTRELYLRPVYQEYSGEELVGPWMSSMDAYSEEVTPTTGAFVIDFGGELTSFEITPFMLQTLLDSLGIRQHFTDGAGLLNSLMDQAQGRVRSEEELLHLSRPLKVIAIGDQLPAGLTFKPISKDVLPGLPGKFIR